MSSERKNSRVWARIGVLLLLGTAIMSAVFKTKQALNMLRDEQRMQTYAVATGTIASVDVHEQTTLTYTWYSPVVSYRYFVGDVEYAGRSPLAMSTRSLSAAGEVAARYSRGQQLTVWYNPEEPNASSLSARAHRPEDIMYHTVVATLGWAVSACGVVFVGYTLWAASRMRRVARTERDSGTAIPLTGT